MKASIGIRTEAAQFHLWEGLFQIFSILSLQCGLFSSRNFLLDKWKILSIVIRTWKKE